MPWRSIHHQTHAGAYSPDTGATTVVSRHADVIACDHPDQLVTMVRDPGGELVLDRVQLDAAVDEPGGMAMFSMTMSAT